LNDSEVHPLRGTGNRGELLSRLVEMSAETWSN